MLEIFITNSIEASKALLEDTIKIVDDKILDIQPNLGKFNSIKNCWSKTANGYV